VTGKIFCESLEIVEETAERNVLGRRTTT